jgi:hypothetical protein
MWPLGWTIGFLARPLAVTQEATLRWHAAFAVKRDMLELRGLPIVDALARLTPLQTPPGRELLVDVRGGWTAHFHNNHLGGDSASWTYHLSGVLGCEGVIASHIPVEQYPCPGTTFEVCGPDARSVRLGRDGGRWTFAARGRPRPYEEVEAYGRKPVCERFTRAMLVRYLAALGIDADDETAFGDALLMDCGPGQPRTSTLAETRAEYLRAVSTDRGG